MTIRRSVCSSTNWRVLFRDRTRHVLLVAERGVGQGLVIAEFARRMAAGSFPFLKDCRVLCTNVRHTPRGASLQTLTTLLNAVVPDPHAIAFIDGIAALLRGEGTGHHATLLSLLSFARCRVIGVVEPWEYEELVSLDVDMLEHFERLDLKEPDYPTAVRLVRRLADGLTERYGCQIPDQAVSMAVGLSANYILNEQLPGKALRVLHRLCEDFSYDRRTAASRPMPSPKTTSSESSRLWQACRRKPCAELPNMSTTSGA